MNPPRGLHGALVVLRKELREALRDRNLVLQVVLIPLFLYPILGFGGYQVYQVILGSEEKKQTVVWMDDDVPASIRESVAQLDNTVVATAPASLQAVDGPADPAKYRRERDALVAEGNPPSALVSWWQNERGTPAAQIVYDSSRDRSQGAAHGIENAMDDYRDELIAERGRTVGMKDGDLRLYRIESESTASDREMGGYVLSMILPMFLIMMLAQGSYYASIDAVVGERERGTLETALSAPISRQSVMLGKFLFVVISSLVAFGLNLASLVIFLRHILGLMGELGDLELALSGTTIAMMAGVAVLTSCVLAALMMLWVIPSTSYREAQTTLTPLYMIIIFGSIATATQESVMGVVMALIPVINVTGLLKAFIRGDMPVVPVAIALVELVVLAVGCVFVAGKLASKDGIFFDPELNLRKLLGLQRGKR